VQLQEAPTVAIAHLLVARCSIVFR